MQRKFLWFLGFFSVGVAVGYGLSYLDGQTRVPRLGPTDVFKVVLPDGTYRHITYAEVERDRNELRQLRQRLARREDPRPHPLPQPVQTTGEDPGPPSGAEPVEPQQTVQEPSSKELGDLFAKIFSRPVMQEIALFQVKRQAGELSAVLGLSKEQRTTLEAELERRRLEQMQGRTRAAPGRPGALPRGEQDVEELYRSLFTPDQYRRYELYTERKREMSRAAVPEQELFELTWRLDLNEEQEIRAGEVLRAQWESMQHLSPTAGLEEAASPVDQFQRFLDTRSEIVSRSTEQFKAFLDEDQIPGYLQYVSEKAMETNLLEKMIRSETPQGQEPAP